MSNLDPRPPRPRRQGRCHESGLGLIELLAGLVVGMIVVISALGTLVLSRQASASIADLSQLQQQGAYALHVIGLQLRQAGTHELVRNTSTGLFTFSPSRAQAASTAFAVFGVDGDGAASDRVSVAFAAGSWDQPPGQFDCSGSRVNSGEQINARFERDANGQLSCRGIAKQPVISNVADFQLLYRVNTGSGIRIMDAREVEALQQWGAVIALEVCLDLQGNQQGPDLSSSYRGCNDSNRARNGRVHLVLRNVYHLRSPSP